MRRPQFSIRALLIAILATACFFGGIHFEQRRKHRESAAAPDAVPRNVQTVYVRIADAAELPGDRGKQLAEAIRSRIDAVSPYKAVNLLSEADSELVCSLSAKGQTPNGGERFLTAKWVDRRGVGIQNPLSLRLRLSELSDGGIINHAAARILEMMEAPW